MTLADNSNVSKNALKQMKHFIFIFHEIDIVCLTS